MDDVPADVAKYAETPEFNEQTVPAKLTAVHDTKAGVWGKLQVKQGALDYVVIGPPETRQRVEAGGHAIIEPQVQHRVEMLGPVLFQVEFYKKAD